MTGDVGVSEGVPEGDGLVVGFGSSVLVTDTAVRGAIRAGVLFDSSAGSLAGVRSTDSRFGLVVQGEPRPDYGDPSNVFSGTEENILTDGALPVPEAPPLPEEP